jgi:acetoin utilization deacetylase AcuC-like enzyme
LDDSFKSFEPDFIGVSAGFDTYNADPIAGLGIQNINTYKLIGEKISSFKLPTFIILEGGYYLPKLGEMVKTFFSGFQKI